MIPSFRSVKFRLTLWYAFVLAIMLSVFSFFMYSEMERALYKDIDERLSFETFRLESSLAGYLKDYLRKVPEREKFAVVSALSPEQNGKLRGKIIDWSKETRDFNQTATSVVFLGLDHNVFLSNLSGWEKEIIFPDFERDSSFMERGRSFQTIHFQKKPIRLYYHAVIYKNNALFIIQSGTSLSEVESALRRLAFIILISIPGAVAAACIAGWFLAKRSFQPVDLMIREAQKITAAYLKGRLPQSGSGDEVDRLAGTLNEMMDRIESSTRAIQDFSSDISHELRTPLAIIRGEVDLALRRSRSPEALIETLRVIEGEVNELIRLVDDLMILVRSDARKLKFEKKKIFLKNVLMVVSNRFKDRADHKRISLQTHLPQDVIVEGDELYLKRLFSNLLDNAIKFTPEGGRIDVTLQPASDQVIVSVADTGIGIETDIQSKVFSRFYRADQARSYEGSGLGLNIAKAICDGHQASIAIHSKPAQGTRVDIAFPILRLN